VAAVCTRKDLVKLPAGEIAGRPVWAVEIELAVTQGLAELEKRLALTSAGRATRLGGPDDKPR
jgi:hypothetical protein